MSRRRRTRGGRWFPEWRERAHDRDRSVGRSPTARGPPLAHQPRPHPMRTVLGRPALRRGRRRGGCCMLGTGGRVVDAAQSAHRQPGDLVDRHQPRPRRRRRVADAITMGAPDRSARVRLRVRAHPTWHRRSHCRRARVLDVRNLRTRRRAGLPCPDLAGTDGLRRRHRRRHRPPPRRHLRTRPAAPTVGAAGSARHCRARRCRPRRLHGVLGPPGEHRSHRRCRRQPGPGLDR